MRVFAVAFAQVIAGNFLERQEAVTIGAVIDETGLETRLDARDDGFVDVALALFLACGLDVEVDQFLAVDDGHPKLFGLGGVEQHAFHYSSPAPISGRGLARDEAGALAGALRLAGGGRGRERATQAASAAVIREVGCGFRASFGAAPALLICGHWRIACLGSVVGVLRVIAQTVWWPNRLCGGLHRRRAATCRIRRVVIALRRASCRFIRATAGAETALFH